ncbi:TPA: hypothetical protein MCA86_004987 [Klebsiella pneumoniae]|nr:hypothetical protein [Escherichia coli]HAX7700825.1 hypothetical protein [Escherichia coli]HAX7778531.1 hypothetical protein [Escherichia coli]HBT5826531.1 hypothetical protein [Klebsiella pneumoniae]
MATNDSVFLSLRNIKGLSLNYYVERLYSGAKEIGNINGFNVWFNERGFYFYWNEETEFLIESWLTFPAYPYGWFK